MQYCKVVLKEMPSVIFAHAYKGSNYDYVLPRQKNTMEITFVEQGDISVIKNGRMAYLQPENSLVLRGFWHDSG